MDYVKDMSPGTVIRNTATGATGSFSLYCSRCPIGCIGVTLTAQSGGTLMEYWAPEQCTPAPANTTAPTGG